MTQESKDSVQLQRVATFEALVSTPFHGARNAICWERTLEGDFSEIVHKFDFSDTMMVLEEAQLMQLSLSEAGHLARETLLSDLRLLKAHGASPTLNLIRNYERDETYPFFPTDVYSFHVDRSPVATDTFLCTYHGACSEVLPNDQAVQKIQVRELREKLRALYSGEEEGFESFLSDHFFDLHYLPQPGACHVVLGQGHLWRLAVDHPGSPVLPCIHRAPEENDGAVRLLLIC